MRRKSSSSLSPLTAASPQTMKEWRSREKLPRKQQLTEYALSGDNEEDEEEEDPRKGSSHNNNNNNNNKSSSSGKTTGTSSSQSSQSSSSQSSAPNAHHHTISFRDLVWEADENNEKPSAQRVALLQNSLRDMARAMKKIIRTDSFGFFLDLDHGGLVDRGSHGTLNEIEQNLTKYLAHGRNAHLDWKAFTDDVARVVSWWPADEHASTTAPTIANDPLPLSTNGMSKEEATSLRIKKYLAELMAERPARLRAAIEDIALAEDIDRLGHKNKEPAMPVWKKQMLPGHPYDLLTDYRPANGLLPEEIVVMREKLKFEEAGAENRWIYPDGLAEIEQWRQVMATDAEESSDKWVELRHNRADAEVEEQHTWGIDCYTRVNVELALAEIKQGEDARVAALRMSPEQVRWFIEYRVMRMINAVRPVEDGWDMRLALRLLLEKYGGDLPDEGDAKAGETTGALGKERKRKKGKQEEEEEEETPLYPLPPGYAPATRAQIRRACRVLLETIARWGEHNFAIHAKGVGVISRVPIRLGRLVAPYWGDLYPSWLWELKEARADEERFALMKAQEGKVILPDFWNIRLEFPSYVRGGYDLFHVDAKNGGNFSSRMSHSCRPNCAAMTAVIGGRYCVAMRALRNVEPGEELTIDYNCVTDSLEEYKAAICLCGAKECRGSFLYITAASAQNEVASRSYTPVHRVGVLLSACFPPGEIERNVNLEYTLTWPRWVVSKARYRRLMKLGLMLADGTMVGVTEEGGETGELRDERGRSSSGGGRRRRSSRDSKTESQRDHTRRREGEKRKRSRQGKSALSFFQSTSSTMMDGGKASRRAEKKRLKKLRKMEEKKKNRKLKKKIQQQQEEQQRLTSQSGDTVATPLAVNPENATGTQRDDNLPPVDDALTTSKGNKRVPALPIGLKVLVKTHDMMEGMISGLGLGRYIVELNQPLADGRTRLKVRRLHLDWDPADLGEGGEVPNLRLEEGEARLGGGGEEQEKRNAMVQSEGDVEEERHLDSLASPASTLVVEPVTSIGEVAIVPPREQDKSTTEEMEIDDEAGRLKPEEEEKEEREREDVKPVKAPSVGGEDEVEESTRHATRSGGGGGGHVDEEPGLDLIPDDGLTEDDIIEQTLRAHHLGERALGMIPRWGLQFAAYAVEYIENESFELPRRRYAQSVLREENVEESWRSLVYEAQGLVSQRITNLVVALDKARHHMCERLTPNLPNDADERMRTERGAGRERWWMNDRCLARWIGDDSAEYPDWYPGTVTHVYVQTQELRILYDSGEVNRIPMSMARRPPPSALADFPEPHTALTVSTHQPPLCPLDDAAVAEILWNDLTSGVAARLVRFLERRAQKPVNLWQTAGGGQNKRTYWWNVETRQAVLEHPLPAECKKTVRFVPPQLAQMQALLAKQAKSGDHARRYLRELRDLMLTYPVADGSRATEDAYQKAVDILTLLSLTHHFFVLHEPPESSAKENHHAVIGALTSWLGQGDSQCPPITEMIGTSLLPHIECAFDESSEPGYTLTLREKLCRHLGSSETRFATWPEAVVKAFGGCTRPIPEPEDMARQWPHPLPPVRLFGSPVLDAAILENVDFSRACAIAVERCNRAAGTSPPSHPDQRDAREMLSDTPESRLILPKVGEAINTSETFARLVSALRRVKRGGRSDIPPIPKVKHYVWVACEACSKWRKLPAHVSSESLPSPFFCEHLVEADPAHAACSVPEEAADDDERTMEWSGDLLNVDALAPGTRLAVYNITRSAWAVAEVTEESSERVKIRYVDDPEADFEWHRKHPVNGEVSSLAPLVEHNPYPEFKSLLPPEAAESERIDFLHVNLAVNDLVNRVINEGHPMMRTKVRTRVAEKRRDKSHEGSKKRSGAFFSADGAMGASEASAKRGKEHHHHHGHKRTRGGDEDEDDEDRDEGEEDDEEEYDGHRKHGSVLSSEERKRRQREGKLRRREMMQADIINSLSSLSAKRMMLLARCLPHNKHQLELGEIPALMPNEASAKERNAMTLYFEALRKIEPLIPMVRMFARWSSMDDAQRALWESTVHIHGGNIFLDARHLTDLLIGTRVPLPPPFATLVDGEDSDDDGVMEIHDESTGGGSDGDHHEQQPATTTTTSGEEAVKREMSSSPNHLNGVKTMPKMQTDEAQPSFPEASVVAIDRTTHAVTVETRGANVARLVGAGVRTPFGPGVIVGASPSSPEVVVVKFAWGAHGYFPANGLVVRSRLFSCLPGWLKLPRTALEGVDSIEPSALLAVVPRTHAAGALGGGAGGKKRIASGEGEDGGLLPSNSTSGHVEKRVKTASNFTPHQEIIIEHIAKWRRYRWGHALLHVGARPGGQGATSMRSEPEPRRAGGEETEEAE